MSPPVLAPPSFSRDGEAVRNIRKITFTFPRVSLAAGAGAAMTPVGIPRSRGPLFRQGFGSSPEAQWGDEEYYPPLSPQTCPVQDGL